MRLYIFTLICIIFQRKCKGCPVTCQHAQKEGIEGGERSAPSPGSFAPRKRFGDYGARPGRGSEPV